MNIDPPIVTCLSIPGTDEYRLRPDEGGYDNLVLAGDWTDSGLNAGCIEAAVLGSGGGRRTSSAAGGSIAFGAPSALMPAQAALTTRRLVENRSN